MHHQASKSSHDFDHKPKHSLGSMVEEMNVADAYAKETSFEISHKPVTDRKGSPDFVQDPGKSTKDHEKSPKQQPPLSIAEQVAAENRRLKDSLNK